MSKKMLYCIGINELVEHKERFAEAVNERMSVFDDAGDSIEVAVTYFPGDKSQWDSVNDKLSDEIFAIVEKQVGAGKVSVLDAESMKPAEVAESFDAYYGSPSPYVVEFISAKKPVMLCDYDIDC